MCRFPLAGEVMEPAVPSAKGPESALVQILIADSGPFARHGLRCLLGQASPDWRIVAEAGDAAEAVILARLSAPHVAVVDPDITGGDAGRLVPCYTPWSVCSLLAEAGIFVVAYSDGSTEPARELLVSGALCIISKRAPVSELVGAVRGLTYKLESGIEMDRQPGVITRRELEIARLLASGERNKEIAWKLGLSIRTVEAHRESIRRKLGVDSIAELARLFATGEGIDGPSRRNGTTIPVGRNILTAVSPDSEEAPAIRQESRFPHFNCGQPSEAD